MLLTVGKLLSNDQQKRLRYYGQEKNTATYNLTRMNLILHGVRPEMMDIRNGDTLGYDWPEDPDRPDEGILFDAVVMNPPYSMKNWNREGLKVSDPRFEIAGVLPPDSKGDFAFLLHGLYHLNAQGTMAIVLPHGVLFRGGAEGEIRKRLLEKNYIDTIIGLPSNLFTNTGIPVSVIILKKDRALGEPVLIIDASKDFIKQGKQNTLQEKDIARIVDTYLDRLEVDGYSHLAYREEIIENEYNLNIPRYVASNTEEIPHDVDGHLYGGIPARDIKNLKTLKQVAKEELYQGLEEIRSNYYTLTQSIEDLTQNILESKSVLNAMNKMEDVITDYINQYWEQFIVFNNVDQLNDLMEEMLTKIKEIMQGFTFVDTYNGYQLLAELWNKSLSKDLELIAEGDFYELGRTREPNLVTKGSGNKKRVEQDGWQGRLVPNELIEDFLFQSEKQAINELQNELDANESELSEVIEQAKEEGTDEFEALNDLLKRNKEDEIQDSFDKTAVKKAEKEISKSDENYQYIKQVQDLLNDSTKYTKEIKDAKKQLDEDVANRILELTDQEISDLMYKKWFGELVDSMKSLIEEPIHHELNILKELDERYGETINDLDKEIAELEAEFEELASQLINTRE